MQADGLFEFGVEYKGRRYESAAVGLEALARNLGGGMDGVADAIKAELLDFLRDTANDLIEFHSADWSPSGMGGPALKRRSGRALRSIAESVQVTGDNIDNIRGMIGGVGYLKIHEYGGTINAKNSRYLTIPLPPALRANGTPKMKSARDWPNTFVITSKKGNKLICQRRGKQVVPLYLLRRSVRIPARLGMRRRLMRDAQVFTDRAMHAAYKQVIANVG